MKATVGKGERLGSYSPSRRTAVVCCGTGAHGAYHAGVLRGLHEAGVKIDLVAGQGVGAAAAALAAIDGAARLWDSAGVWRTLPARGLYRWRPLIVAIGWVAALLLVVLLAPFMLLLAGLIVYPIGFLLSLLGMDAGSALIAWFSALLLTAFSSSYLPTIVPRLAMVVLVLLVAVAFTGVLVADWRAPVKRRADGRWWWRIIGSPLEAQSARTLFASAIWNLIRGAAPSGLPSLDTIGRRYAEVLGENLGQLGFRELVMVATDLDARRDLVAALLREPFRRDFHAPRSGVDRRADVLDLASTSSTNALDLLAASLTPPLACDPALVTFASDSFWRGETHRLCDRPGSCSRLIEEVASAGVTQVIVVSAVSPSSAPHALTPPRLDLRHRLGEFLTASECAALRDALELARVRFDAVFLICPPHNPVGPFDFAGAYDESSDRRQDLAELMERACEDAYRQFIEPIVGASGEHLARVSAAERAVPAGQANGHTLFDQIDT